MDNQQELFPIVDESGQVVGSATRGECHSGSKLLHPVVHLHVFNSNGDVYLQKRPDWKDIQPGKWDTAVGGHIDYGETPEEALLREVREELGITDFKPERVDKYVFESSRERELVYVHRTTYDGKIRPSTKELDGGRFWTMQEIREAMGSPPDTAHRLHQHTDAGDFCVKMRPISPLHSIFFTFHSFMSHFFFIFVPEIAHCSPSVPKCTTFLLTALIKNNN